MNQDRRNTLDLVMKSIETAAQHLTDARHDLECVRDEEQEYLDNMPEAFQDGDRGQRAQEVIDQCEEGIDALETIDADMSTANDAVEEARA